MNNWRSYPVYMYDENGEYVDQFSSLTETAKYLSIDVGWICISIKRKHCIKGTLYLSKIKYDKYPVPVGILRIPTYFRKESETEWTKCENRCDAARKTGINPQTLIGHMNPNNIIFYKGYYFKQTGEPGKYRNLKVPVILTNLKNGDNLEFPTVLVASQTLNLDYSDLCKCLTNKRRATKGWTAKFKTTEGKNG